MELVILNRSRSLPFLPSTTVYTSTPRPLSLAGIIETRLSHARPRVVAVMARSHRMAHCLRRADEDDGGDACRRSFNMLH